MTHASVEVPCPGQFRSWAVVNSTKNMTIDLNTGYITIPESGFYMLGVHLSPYCGGPLSCTYNGQTVYSNMHFHILNVYPSTDIKNNGYANSFWDLDYTGYFYMDAGLKIGLQCPYSFECGTVNSGGSFWITKIF